MREKGAGFYDPAMFYLDGGYVGFHLELLFKLLTRHLIYFPVCGAYFTLRK